MTHMMLAEDRTTWLIEESSSEQRKGHLWAAVFSLIVHLAILFFGIDYLPWKNVPEEEPMTVDIVEQPPPPPPPQAQQRAPQPQAQPQQQPPQQQPQQQPQAQTPPQPKPEPPPEQQQPQRQIALPSELAPDPNTKARPAMGNENTGTPAPAAPKVQTQPDTPKPPEPKPEAPKAATAPGSPPKPEPKTEPKQAEPKPEPKEDAKAAEAAEKAEKQAALVPPKPAGETEREKRAEEQRKVAEARREQQRKEAAAKAAQQQQQQQQQKSAIPPKVDAWGDLVGSGQPAASGGLQTRVDPNASASNSGQGGTGGGAAARYLSDYVLGQIIKRWAFDYKNPRYRMAAITMDVQLNQDGTLTSPLGKADPWNPARMVVNYNQLGSDEQWVMSSFLIAMRNAQPFTIPDSEKNKGPWPRTLSFQFNFRDL